MTEKATKIEELIRTSLDYDPTSGLLTWRPRPVEMFRSYRGFRVWNSRFPGAVAGSQMKNGYVIVRVNRKALYAHRIAFFLHYGHWPAENVDHINGVRDDNRIENLRQANHSQNSANMFCIKGKVPHKGVYRHRDGKYMAQIKCGGEYHYLGYHDTADEAHAAYIKKAKELHGEFANAGAIQ